MITIADLTTPLTYTEIRSTMYSVLAGTGVTTSNWKPGAVVRTIISAVSIVLAGLSMLIAALAGSAFLPLATGEWLRLVALYCFNVTKIEATFATGLITITNSSGSVYSFDPGDLTFRNPTTKKTYTNIEPVSIGALAEVLGVQIAAVEVGAASTSYAGEISELASGINGLTCVNPEPVVGYDAESDPALRQRCTDKLGSLSPNGPKDAYGYIARSTLRPDGSAIGITRVNPVRDGNGGVDVYVASAGGAVVPSDLALIDDAVQKQCVPLCVVARVSSAVAVDVPITYTAWMYNTSGLTAAEIQQVIADEISSYFEQSPIGGYSLDGESGRLYLSELQAVIGRARTAAGALLPIIRVSVATPAADVELGGALVPVLGVVSGTINQIAPVGA